MNNQIENLIYANRKISENVQILTDLVIQLNNSLILTRTRITLLEDELNGNKIYMESNLEKIHSEISNAKQAARNY